MNSTELLHAIKSGALSAAQACENAIARIEATEPQVNAYTDRTLAQIGKLV